MAMTGLPVEAAFHGLAARCVRRAASDLPSLLRLPEDVAAGRHYRIQTTLKRAIGRVPLPRRGVFGRSVEDATSQVERLLVDCRDVLVKSTVDPPQF